jgi:hypothetical protein
MPHLVTDGDLTAFLGSIGISEDSLKDLGHEELLGFTAALLDYEARIQRDPGPDTYGSNGYTSAVKTLASRDAADDDSLGYATLAVRLAEQNIGFLISLVAELEATSAETPPLVKPLRSMLYASGLLFNMTNNRLTDQQYKDGVKAVIDRIVEARGAIDDAKKAMRERGVKL